MATAVNGRQPALSKKRERELVRRAAKVLATRDEFHAAIVAAHQDDGATIRAIATAVNLSPARVHAIVKAD